MKKPITLAVAPMVFAFLSLAAVVVNAASTTAGLTVTWQVASSVRPGGETTALITLSNPSTTLGINNIKAYISGTNDVSADIASFEIAGLSAGSSQQTAVKVKASPAATASTSYLTVTLNYNMEGSSSQQQTTVSIPVTINRAPTLQIQNIRYSKSEIEPGNTVELKFDIINVGDGTAKNILVGLSQSADTFTVVGSSGQDFIQSIAVNGKATASFNLILSPSIAVGTKLIPVTFSYYDETKSQNFSDTQYIGLTVSGEYNFIVTLDVQDYLLPGQIGTVNIKIANAGVQDAEFVTVKPVETEQFKQITPQVVYVGSLKSDDYDTEKFTLRAGTVQPGIYPLKISMTYRDQYGSSYNQTYETNVRVYSAEEIPRTGTVSPLTVVIVVAVIAAVAYFGYRRFFKKKSK